MSLLTLAKQNTLSKTNTTITTTTSNPTVKVQKINDSEFTKLVTYDHPQFTFLQAATALLKHVEKTAKHTEKRKAPLVGVYDAFVSKRKKTSQGQLNMKKFTENKERLPSLIREYMDPTFALFGNQKKIVEAVTTFVASKVYGPDWEFHESSFLEDNAEFFEKYGFPRKMLQFIWISMSRQFGKTTCVAFLMACLLVSCPIRILLFAQNERSSKNLLGFMKNYVSLLLGFDDARITEWSATVIRLLPEGVNKDNIKQSSRKTYPGSSWVRSLPTGTDNLRGMSADVYIIDEAAFIDPDMLYSAILPMAMNGKALTIMMSSSNNTECFYETLPDVKLPNGKPVMFPIRASMVCMTCVENGQKEEACPHNIHDMPPWRSNESLDISKALMPPDVFAKEIQGFAVDAEHYALERKQVDYMKSIECVVDSIGNASPFIWFFIDTPGGGNQRLGSKLAILGVHVHRGVFTITNIENQHVTDINHQEHVCQDHFNAMMRDQRYAKKYMKNVFVETNLSNVQASSVHEHLRRERYQPIYLIEQKKKNKENLDYGVLTTNEVKETGLKMLQFLINNKRIKRLAHLVGTNADKDYEEFCKQLGYLRIEEIGENSPTPKCRITGKGQLTQDDLAISLICLLTHMARYAKDPAFVSLMKQKHQLIEYEV